MAAAPSRIVRLHRRPATAPVAPLLSPTTCVWSVEDRPAGRPSALSKLSGIHNADLDREMARRWLDEDYDFYAPEEVARRNELYEAFARRVAALQSGDADLGGRTDIDEFADPASDELLLMEKIVVEVGNDTTVPAKPSESAPRPPAPEPAISVSPSAEPATELHTIDVDRVPETEALCEHLEKKVAEGPSTSEVVVTSKVIDGFPSLSLSTTQRQELEMVKAYLAKLDADFEWESTASQGLKPTSEECVIGLSAYVLAFGFEKALKHVCGVLSIESPFETRPAAINDDDEPLPETASRAVEKGVLCARPRRFYGAPDGILNRSRETLAEEIRRMKLDLAIPQVPVPTAP
ncbi:hypothetical protein GSI_09523 [Ganoderma sinense ZZ0214-1]|uniref:Uncharacterized protein n=1 Tax=Ganoderma sinense ZZ0214-1 TaxID=1077348 RepID=A0A2G8S3M8_9APHY|nr:hypothetical protein GSI_09523 [Ganoderma sinense ZZ0214-1]